LSSFMLFFALGHAGTRCAPSIQEFAKYTVGHLLFHFILKHKNTGDLIFLKMDDIPTIEKLAKSANESGFTLSNKHIGR
jgi:hypothetical protein